MALVSLPRIRTRTPASMIHPNVTMSHEGNASTARPSLVSVASKAASMHAGACRPGNNVGGRAPERRPILTKGAFIDNRAFRWHTRGVANGCGGTTIQARLEPTRLPTKYAAACRDTPLRPPGRRVARSASVPLRTAPTIGAECRSTCRDGPGFGYRSLHGPSDSRFWAGAQAKGRGLGVAGSRSRWLLPRTPNAHPARRPSSSP